MTIQDLEALGANTKEGLARCINNEGFYIRMVTLGLGDAGFEKLLVALAEGDLDAGFEAAHALKGVMGNLALTPIVEPVNEITEHLRAREPMNYGPLMEKIMMERDKFLALG